MPDDTSSPVTAFVSWAHGATGLDERNADEWERVVVRFATLLRTYGGIDAEIDAYHYSDPDVDWTRFGPREIDARHYVLVVLNRAWRERWEGQNDPTTGAGAAAEANALKSLFDRNQAQFHRKVKLVLLPGIEDDVVPTGLHGVPRFRLADVTAQALEDLIRTLTGQPRYIRPEVGALPIFPTGPIAPTDSDSPWEDLSREIQQIDEQLGVNKSVLAGLPEPQPGEGPHLPWWRAWHQAQSRIAELQEEREVLVGRTRGLQRATVAEQADEEIIRVDAEYVDRGKGRGRLLLINNSSVALHDLEFELPPEAGTSFHVVAEPVRILPVGKAVGFVAMRTFGQGSDNFEIPISARTGDGRPVTTTAFVSLV